MFARGCVCESVWRSKDVPVGAGRMCRGHRQQRLGEGVRVSRSVYAGQCCLTCVCLEDKCPHSCVLGGQWLCVSLSVPVSELPVVSVYVCVGVCIAGLWQCMVLSLVISEHLCGAAVCTVSLCVHQRL